jgi:large subunit ribosomal protein L5
MAKKTKAASTATLEPAATPRMLEHYTQSVRPHLAEKLERSNPHAIPRLEKVVISMGVGAAVTEK